MANWTVCVLNTLLTAYVTGDALADNWRYQTVDPIVRDNVTLFYYVLRNLLTFCRICLFVSLSLPRLGGSTARALASNVTVITYAVFVKLSEDR